MTESALHDVEMALFGAGLSPGLNPGPVAEETWQSIASRPMRKMLGRLLVAVGAAVDCHVPVRAMEGRLRDVKAVRSGDRQVWKLNLSLRAGFPCFWCCFSKSYFCDMYLMNQ